MVTLRFLDRGRLALSLLQRARIAIVALVALADLRIPVAAQPTPPILFTDATEHSGIDFVHRNGAVGDYWYPELFGGGVAVLDIDGDLWPDLLFVNGRTGRRAGAAPDTDCFATRATARSTMSSPAAVSTPPTSMVWAPRSPTTTTTGATTSS